VQIPGLENASLAELVVFAILAGATVLGGLFTITRRNPVTAVMSLVATFVALAGIYASLSAHFLAVLQVLVYAGAIMVLFIFVVMILNRDDVDLISWRGFVTRAVGVVLLAYGTVQAVRLVYLTRETPVLRGGGGDLPEGYATVASTGLSLFRDFVFPFEAISLLLLVAVVGGVIVSRSHHQEERAEDEVQRLKAVRAAAHPEQRVVPQGEVGGAPALPPASPHDLHHSPGAH
jgi:NADH-quinone oxidoreductase subunit J